MKKMVWILSASFLWHGSVANPNAKRDAKPNVERGTEKKALEKQAKREEAKNVI